MRITDEITNLKEMMKLDKEMLIHRIYEAWQAREAGTDKLADRFVLGLRYSEFLANGFSDEDYMGAERRRGIYLERLGVTRQYVNETLKEVYGLA